MSTNALFTEYIAVVNETLGRHRDSFPYGAIIKAGEKMYGDQDIGVAVYKDDAQAPHDHFTLRFEGGTFGIEDFAKKDGTEVLWRIPDQHIKNVVENPETFKAKPGRLDLDWLATRLGISDEAVAAQAS